MQLRRSKVTYISTKDEDHILVGYADGIAEVYKCDEEGGLVKILTTYSEAEEQKRV